MEQCHFPERNARSRKKTRHETVLEQRVSSLEQLLRHVRGESVSAPAGMAIEQSVAESVGLSGTSETVPSPMPGDRSSEVQVRNDGTSVVNTTGSIPSWVLGSTTNSGPIIFEVQGRSDATTNLDVAVVGRENNVAPSAREQRWSSHQSTVSPQPHMDKDRGVGATPGGPERCYATPESPEQEVWL